ncbi:hypothetical protein HKX48_001219 [Thoreauomyces humboldtii]|nr:hypothetical protein HKX48_001219 [Thoreauomyces humboldtii]
MTIVGDVHYYVVSTADPTGTPIEDVNHNDRRNSFDSVRSSAASFRSFASARSGGAASSIRSMLSVLSVSSAASGQAGARREFDGFRWRKKSRGRSAGSSSGDPLLHPEQEGGGLSRLLGMGGNGGNRKRTLHLIMRPDAVADGVEDVVSLTEEEGGRPGGSSGSKNGRIRQRPSSAQPLSTSGQKESRSRRNSMDDAYVEEVEGEDTTEGSAQGKGNSSRRGKDKATGTGVALRPGSTTPKIHRRVRSISFSNEQQQQRSRGGLGTGEALNVQEWIQSHDTDLPADVDQDDQTLVRPRPTRINTASNHPRPKNRTPLLEQALLSPSPPTTYIARYYASDDDFLMKSTVRAYFKQHALETSDAVLFTIPSSSTVEPQDILEGTEAHPALTGFVYAVSEEGTGWMGMGGRGAGRIVKWIMMGYIVIGFLLIKFIVPAPYAYITAFVLIFLMCLVMILCM